MLKLESDSQLVKLFNEGNNENHPHSNIISHGNHLLKRTGSTLTDMYRNANQRVDHLACMGAQQEESLIYSL